MQTQQLSESEALRLKESKIEISRQTVRSMVRGMCGAQLEDRKRVKERDAEKHMKKQVEEESIKPALSKKDAFSQSKLTVGINQIATNAEVNPPTTGSRYHKILNIGLSLWQSISLTNFRCQ